MANLSSTSALVLLWVQQGCYKSRKAQQYLRLLDLSAGQGLHERCVQVWPYYHEVIRNRKYGVFHLIEDTLNGNQDICQVVIAGAGLDALGIEAIERYPDIKVFEIDKGNMGLKSSIFSNLSSSPNPNIHFVETDLCDNLYVDKVLTDHGWNRKQPTLLICEGISYYLPQHIVGRLMASLMPSRTIFEFLKREEDLTFERAMIARRIFGIILNACKLPEIVRYNYRDVQASFGMSVLERYSLMRLEQMRTGLNTFFSTEESGWIEVCLLGERAADIGEL
jgi:hypothetical protein